MWLMPFVPPEVTAASGALLLPHLGSLAVARALMAGSMVCGRSVCRLLS